MINNNSDNNMKTKFYKTDKIETRTAHPCPNCTKPCLGRQCSECHMKMLEKQTGKCDDCDIDFPKIRPDGTTRKRCKECQTKYEAIHIATCPICKETYHAILKDGRTFDKCYKCRQESLNNKCESCGSKAFGHKFCKTCYDTSRKANYENRGRGDTFRDERPLVKCKTLKCNNTTTYAFCRECNATNKKVSEQYLISSCLECGKKMMGDYKFCSDCT